MLTARSNLDIFNRETLAYVQQHLLLQGKKVLEVGCGAGDFSYTLMQQGAVVTACDTNEASVQLARGKGVAALHTDFLSFESGLFDAIIFTRSLHHIHQLQQAIKHAKSLLTPTGMLLIEDFDLDMIDEGSARWYYDTKAIVSLCTRGQACPYVDEPLTRWYEEHSHQPALHKGKNMLLVVQDSFSDFEITRNAYFYRSICSNMSTHPESYAMTEKVLTIENGLIQQERILANGLRIMAQNV